MRKIAFEKSAFEDFTAWAIADKKIYERIVSQPQKSGRLKGRPCKKKLAPRCGLCRGAELQYARCFLTNRITTGYVEGEKLWRRRKRWSLPVSVRGRLATNSIWRGYL